MFLVQGFRVVWVGAHEYAVGGIAIGECRSGIDLTGVMMTWPG
jgi:hypothetical protein